MSVINEKLEIICGAIHILFKRINCSMDQFRITLAFEDKVTPANLKMYLGAIEQRFLKLICILKFIGLHQVITYTYISNFRCLFHYHYRLYRNESVLLEPIIYMYNYLTYRITMVTCCGHPGVYTGYDPEVPPKSF